MPLLLPPKRWGDYRPAHHTWFVDLRIKPRVLYIQAKYSPSWETCLAPRQALVAWEESNKNPCRKTCAALNITQGLSLQPEAREGTLLWAHGFPLCVEKLRQAKEELAEGHEQHEAVTRVAVTLGKESQARLRKPGPRQSPRLSVLRGRPGR